MKQQLVDLDCSTRPGKWVRRGPQPEFVKEIANPLVRVAELCRKIRECRCPFEKARLESQFRRIEQEAIRVDAITKFALPGELTPPSERLAALFPDPLAGYSLLALERNANITRSTLKDWLVKLDDKIVIRNTNGCRRFHIAAHEPAQRSDTRLPDSDSNAVKVPLRATTGHA